MRDKKLTPTATVLNQQQKPITHHPSPIPRSVTAPAAILILLFAIFSFTTSRQTSQTVDEFVKIPAAASYLKTGDLRMDALGTPPLARFIIGAPMLFLHPAIPHTQAWRTSNSWRYGWDFMAANADKYIALNRLARIPGILFTITGLIILFLWAFRLLGPAGALLALAVLCLDPNLIAHSAIAGTDAPLTVFTMLTFFFWFLYMEKERLPLAAAAGVCLGAAFLVKFNAGMMLPALLVLAIINPLRRPPALRKKSAARSATALAILLITSVIIINTGYLWRGSFSPTGSYNFQSHFFQSTTGALPSATPLPFPKPFIEQLDANMTTVSHANILYYLRGQTSPDGWWNYYLIAYLIKTPIPIMLLLSLGIFAALKSRRPATLLPLIPAAAFLFFFSFVSRIDLGYRYLLPMLPFIALVASNAASLRRARPIYALLLLWMLISTALTHPNHVAYFNELIGGPKNGRHWLADSNLDWGQNLPALRDYMQRNNIPRVYLAHFGYVSPAFYGVNYYAAPCEPAPGTFAISPQYYYNIFPFQHRADCFNFLRARPPDDVVANTYLIYRFPSQSRPLDQPK